MTDWQFLTPPCNGEARRAPSKGLLNPGAWTRPWALEAEGSQIPASSRIRWHLETLPLNLQGSVPGREGRPSLSSYASVCKLRSAVFRACNLDLHRSGCNPHLTVTSCLAVGGCLMTTNLRFHIREMKTVSPYFIWLFQEPREKWSALYSAWHTASAQ